MLMHADMLSRSIPHNLSRPQRTVSPTTPSFAPGAQYSDLPADWRSPLRRKDPNESEEEEEAREVQQQVGTVVEYISSHITTIHVCPPRTVCSLSIYPEETKFQCLQPPVLG